MKGRNYRSARGQAFTRLKYIHGSPAVKVSKFNMGDKASKFPRRVHLETMETVQIRHNALESGRVAANKVLFDKYGETGYHLQLCVFPHIILRENKMIATAGADRLQEGMRRAFGKPTGRAARVHVGQSIYIIYVPADGVDVARKACQSAGSKMPMKTRVIVEEVAVEEPAEAPVESMEEPGAMVEEESATETVTPVAATGA